MEGLHDLLKTAQSNRWIRGFKVKSSNDSTGYIVVVVVR